MANISVQFEEHEDSPDESGDRTGNISFTRIFLTAWADRWTFLRELFSGGLYGLPMSYDLTNWPGVMADKWSIEKLINKPTSATPTITNPMTQRLEHGSKAKITVTYSPYDVEDEETLEDGSWVSYDCSDAVEFINTPGRGMSFETSGELLPDDVSPVIPQSITRHTITWHQVSDNNFDTISAEISAAKGKINLTAFRLLGTQKTAAIGTLMLLETTERKTISLQGETTHELTLVFAEKAQKALVTGAEGAIGASGTVYGWNYMWDPKELVYDKPVTDDGKYLFDTTELSDIFNGGA